MKENVKSIGLLTAVAALALAAGVASGQCQITTGPDVIVGDLTGPSNYTFASGLESTSLGTVSCNIGNAQLLWIANDNRHPVIGGNLYKYTAATGPGTYGKFEQIAQSWLKHGFYALSQTLCCPSCAGTNGSTLGIGCSDPYTSARNGSEGGLGPRRQVNASTGVFTYPPANPTFATNQRRLSPLPIDLTASSTTVKYFGESQYVTPDDASSGNKFNNSSVREMTVTGSGTAWAFGLTGVTVRRTAAIERWAFHDPAVLLETVIVPNALPIATDPYKGEGKYIVGSRATDLGGGIWHYEYAIFNQNSHRSGGSFDVPVPAGVVVTNVGFHDVAYLAGDGEGNVAYSGTDWASDTSGNKVGWATEAQSVNTNANALRWGTTYNFRFDANTPPVTNGQATVGLWRAPAANEPANFTARVMSPSAPVGTPCDVDWNGDDAVDVPDIFAFLSDWFGDVPAAQNFGGQTGVPAIFAYLSEWFAHGVGPC